MNQIKTTGVKETHATGAVRDLQRGKGRFDLISPHFALRLNRFFAENHIYETINSYPHAILAVAHHYEGGVIHGGYAPRNWEKGMPYTRMYDSCRRHTTKACGKAQDENHLAAGLWNAIGLLHYEEELPQELDDRLQRYGVHACDPFHGNFAIFESQGAYWIPSQVTIMRLLANALDALDGWFGKLNENGIDYLALASYCLLRASNLESLVQRKISSPLMDDRTTMFQDDDPELETPKG